MGRATPPESEWSDLKAPGLDEFRLMAAQAWEGLPESFRAHCADIVIRVADFPDDEVMQSMELDSPFELLGLFEGVGMAHGDSTPQTGQWPNTIHLYRRAILDYWAEQDETLGAIVTHVLIHEIGHHFGLSDADMEALEMQAD